MLSSLRGPVRIPSPFVGEVFFMSKPFKEINEQISLLQGRGLIITDIEYAKSYLLSNNYYNIINGYSKYFPQSGDTYIQGTSFEEVSRLYLFDKEMKQAFFRSIITVESHLKSIFAYRFAELYPNIPYAYLNINCYDPSNTLSIISTISRISSIINRNNSPRYRNSSIYHYIHSHNDLPIWVLVNYLDFGEVRFMLKASTKQLQNRVAKDMTSFIAQHIPLPFIFTPETMLSFLTNINEVRNVCAHNNRLLGFKCRQDVKYWAPLHKKYNIAPDSPKSNVYLVFIAMQCFLSHTEYATLHNSVRKLMNNHLKNHLRTVAQDDILNTLGFPAGWNMTSEKIIQ